jgi:hypothetical protein
MNRIEALRALGVQIGHETVWKGEVPNRYSEENPESVQGAELPLSEHDWCQIAMNEGEHYTGGCCGTSSAMQDIINGAFRDSGYLDNAALLKLGQLAQSHGDYGPLSELELTDEQFQSYLDRFDTLDPWDKIGVVFQACAPYLQPRSHEMPLLGRPDLDEHKSIQALENVLYQLSWNDFRLDDDPTKQHLANRMVLFARGLGPARQFLKKLEDTLEPFEGYAIMERGTDKVLVNGYGLCLYADEAEPAKVIESWRRAEEDEDQEDRKQGLPERAEIVPVRVTVEDGVQRRDV